MVIETHHFKTFSFLLHGYYTPRLKNIAILAIVFSPYNFKILPICYMEHFCICNPTSFFCRWVVAICQLLLLLLVILLCYFHTMLYALDTLCPWAMVPIKRLLQFWYPTPFSKQVFTRFVCCFTRNTLSTFFWFDLTDYCKRIMHSRQCKFFLSTYCWSVLILLFCVYMFLRALFHSSCLNICITSYLASY